MKKLIVICIVAVVAYAVLGIVAGCFLPKKIKEAEAKLPGIGVAISRITADQRRVSERMREVTALTLGKGRSKVDEVAMMLGDPELNRIALAYLGSDWSIPRSSFLGNVKHSRELMKVKKAERMGEETLLNKKIKELENRKHSLQNRLRSAPRSSAERALSIELNDVERQLTTFRGSNTYREYVEKDNVVPRHIGADAKSEDELYNVACQYQAKTIGALNRDVAEKLESLRIEEAEPSRLRWQMSLFNVWPLNLVCKMPEEK